MKFAVLSCVSAIAISLAMGAQSAEAQSRDSIRIVGSSTVFPFTTATSENFGSTSGFRTPVVESTGTGGGMNLFCAGVGLRHPDITGASRRMLPGEFELCRRNGVTAITEVPIGYDGIVVTRASGTPSVDFQRRDLFLALAFTIPMPVDDAGEAVFSTSGQILAGRDFNDVAGYSCEAFIPNPHRRWSDVSNDLPSDRIEVIGPPPTSGTRDSWIELGIQPGARQIECLDALRASDRARFDEVSSRLREDGPWIDGGENDNVIVQTIANSATAFGVFGYSYLEQNADRLTAATIEGVEPEYDDISEGVYPIARSMFVYVKNQHVAAVPGIAEWVEELTSEDAFGPFGYLADRGLVALPEAERDRVREHARALTPLTGIEAH
ncbi:phosphate ABC transporter periplasmic binding protein [Glycocaulis alkaliphilus]|uniref:Phosphate ABC transporter periplasmic binding protein n=1 Tax=Glycocaulis alkaliphilus TaxID=1434191 RepID=A0A3T0E852_9PROT|nr:substrate-binding domain-containing protein [Glycocaulis alkaliphilus]AZU03512.1 phosphate ABC transporter periplasmic binding protein [Glycocaulis alkaliphilus]GGB74073.1 phosphate ABC transporter substrate-binding protein [Glycocaulis alkaliphilus]